MFLDCQGDFAEEEDFLKNLFFYKFGEQAWYMFEPDFYAEANKEHAEFLGVEPSDMRGARVRDFLPEEHAEKFISDNEEVFDKGEKNRVDQVLTDDRGEERILSITRQPILDKENEVTAILCMAEDVTDWRRAEKNLYEKEELFQSIISTMPDLLMVLDSDGRYLRMWTGNYDILYAPRSEMLGKKVAEVLPAGPAEKIMDNLNKALESVDMQIFEYKLEVMSGEKYFEGRVKAAGRNRAVMVVRDITDRVNVHNKIRELHNIAADLGSSQSEDEIYRRTVEAAEKILEFDVCSLDIVEDDMLVVKATSSGVPEGGSVSEKISESGIAGKVYKTQEPHRTDDINNEPDAKPVSGEYKAAITIPIDEYGIFQAVSTEKGKFDKEDMQMAELLLSHTSTALKRLEAEKEIRYLGFHDKLTALYNRKYIEEELNRLDTPRQHPLTVLLGDVNSLKLVNDAFGHEEGDRLLKLMADILQDSCREEDIVGRFGGDEFILVLPATDRDDAEGIRRRIRENCSRVEDQEVIPVSIALGIASKTDSDEEISEVIKRADARMYEDKMAQGDKNREAIFNKLLEQLGERQFETMAHCSRVKEMAGKMGKALGWPEKKLNHLKDAALLHDIGLISVDDDIINSSRPLTRREWKQVKKHSEIGYRIARSSDELSSIAPIVLHHHERWDGCGYPRRLQRENIPVEARVVALVDAFDVMINGKVYKEKMSKDEAVAELKEEAGKQFDPELVNTFVKEIL